MLVNSPGEVKSRLDELWQLLRKVDSLLNDVDTHLLDESDFEQYEQIAKINFSYSTVLMQCWDDVESEPDSHDVSLLSLEVINHFDVLIETHADESVEALECSLHEQRDGKFPAVAYAGG